MIFTTTAIFTDPSEMSRLALRILAAAAAAALALPRCRGLAFAPYSALGPVMIGQGREVAEGEAYAVNVVASACELILSSDISFSFSCTTDFY